MSLYFLQQPFYWLINFRGQEKKIRFIDELINSVDHNNFNSYIAVKASLQAILEPVFVYWHSVNVYNLFFRL